MVFDVSDLGGFVEIVGAFLIIAGGWNLLQAVTSGFGGKGDKAIDAVEKGLDGFYNARDRIGSDILKERSIGRKLTKITKKTAKNVDEIIKTLETFRGYVEKAISDPRLIDTVAEQIDKIYPAINKSLDSLNLIDETANKLEIWIKGEFVELKNVLKIAKEKEKEYKKEGLEEQVDAFLGSLMTIKDDIIGAYEQLEELKKLVEEVKKLEENVRARMGVIAENVKLRSMTGLNNAIVDISNAINDMEKIKNGILSVEEYDTTVNALMQRSRETLKGNTRKKLDELKKATKKVKKKEKKATAEDQAKVKLGILEKDQKKGEKLLKK